MRATSMRTCQLFLLFTALTLPGRSAVRAQVLVSDPPARDIFMRSRWEFLPPILETEENISLYSGYEANGGPGQKSYSRFGGTQHMFLPDGVISFNAEGIVTNYGQGGATALLHTRQLIGDSLWGAGASYMVQESVADEIYEQGAVHVEIFPSEFWSVRANAYVPIGTHRREIFNGGPVPLPATFGGNNIVIPTLTNRTLEAAMGGVDVELARQISDMALEVFGGYYKLDAAAGKDAEGGKLGLRGYVTRRLSGHFTVSNDGRFGTMAYGGVTWALGGAAGLAPQNMRDKLLIPVERNHQIIITQTDEVIPGTIIATNMGAPITVTHVRNGAGGTNSGTFENPFNTNMLPGTQGTDIVYLHGGAAPYVNGYTLAPGQRFLGEGFGNQHLVDTDQFGPIVLGAGSGSFARSAIQGPLVAANSTEISNVLLEPVGTGLSLPNLAGMVNVNRSVIDGGVNGGAVGIDVMAGSGDFSFADVTVRDTTLAGLRITGGSSNVTFGTPQPIAPAVPDFLPSTISQSGMGSAVSVAGGHMGTLQLIAGNMITATNGTGLQFDNADGTYSFDGDVTLNGGDAGIDIIGGSDGTFTFANTDITDPAGPAIQIGSTGVAGSGGSADVTLASMSSVAQSNGTSTIVVLGNHTGTLTHDGPITATNGDGFQFGEVATGADGTYDFNGPVTLNGGDAGIDILGSSAGTFTFAATDITSPTGSAFNIDGMGGPSTATVNYVSGTILQTNNVATVSVLDHDTGTVTVSADVIGTDGTGLQFTNADGTYNFDGAMMLDGALSVGDLGIDIVGDSDGVFSFRRPMIVNLFGGPAINIDGGGAGQLAQTTIDGGTITTTGGTGLNIDNTGLTTVLQPTDITSTAARAVNINQSQVDILLRNVISDGSPTEGIDIDGALAGSSFTINGLARVLNSGTNGIDIADSEGTFSFANTDIDVTGGDGVRLDNNIGVTSVSFNGGAVDGTATDGFFVQNTNDVTINNILFGLAAPIGQDAIDYRSTDGIDRAVTITNNLSFSTADIVGRGIVIDQQNAGSVNAVVTGNLLDSSGQTFVTTDGGMAGNVILQLDENAWTTAAGTFASDVTGSGLNSTIVTSFDENSSFGGGMLFDRVTFDATGALLAGFQAQGVGTTTIIAGGDGLSFLNPTGDLSIGEVAITNFGGTGLEVDTKGLGTTFNLQIGNGVALPTGSINTTGGNALFLDPLTGNINIATVTSSGSVVGGASAADSSSTGDGIFIDQFTATGGPSATALRITTLEVDNTAGFGARILNSQGQFDLGTIDLDEIALDGISLVDNNDVNTRVSIDGGIIHDVAGDGINSTNTALTVSNVSLGNIIVDPMMMVDDIPERILQDGIDILQTDGVNRTYFITNTSSMLFADPMTMQDEPLILGRAVNIETTAATTGTLTAQVTGNNLQSGQTALRVQTGMNMNANILSVNASNNTFQTTGMMVPAVPTIDMLGFALGMNQNSLRITNFGDNTVTGNGVGGGVRIERATFQNASDGITSIGDTTNRVIGDGLALIDVSGTLTFETLNIANQDGVGLLATTKGPPATTFTLNVTGDPMTGMGGGTIDTTGGPAMFLDPLNVNMMLDSVSSAGSVVGPGLSNGDGIALQDVTGNLRITSLQVSDAAMEGLHLSQSAGVGTLDLTLDTISISNTGSHGILVDDTMGSNATTVLIGMAAMDGTITDGSISNTAGDGININNVDGIGSQFILNFTTFTGIGGTTGTITNSRLAGDTNIDALFNPGPVDPLSVGAILFNGGVDLLQ